MARMNWKYTVGFAVLLALLALSAFLLSTARKPDFSTPPPAAQTTSTAEPDWRESGACDRQPAPPPLPASLSPASIHIADIVTALDAALNDQHKAWLRCFTADEELLARTQNGMGRWLRTTLHLTQNPELLQALGVSAPDEASSIIILIYAAHLHQQELSPSEAQARRNAALIESGVTQ